MAREILISVYDYQNYQRYLSDFMGIAGKTRGLRARLAEVLNVQPAFISQVLSEKSHFSLEQAPHISDFLGHSEQERDYFFLLVHRGRAGSIKLAEYYDKKLATIHENRKLIRNRIQTNKEISEADQANYFSTWIYTAIHVLLTVPEFQSRVAIARRLNLPLEASNRYLDFLIRLGAAVEDKGKIKSGKTRIHFGNDNAHILKHHLNWRLVNLRALEKSVPDDQHYTCAMSLSSKDALRIKNLWLEFLEKLEPIIKESPEEDIYAITWDFFKI